MQAIELREIIEKQLAAEEFPLDKLKQLTDEIVAAATDRLVFLVAPQQDLVGFEIRSLQEYCAAEAITTGSDTKIQDRLQTIAASSYWRNVFSFAAGKIFIHRQHLRDSVVVICDDLNSNDENAVRLGRVTRAGSRLALDLIFDFVATDETPRYQRRLAARAAEILQTFPNDDQLQLARVPADLLAYVKPFVTEHLIRPNVVEKLGALSFLAELATKGDSVASNELAALYDSNSTGDQEIFAQLGLYFMNPTLLNMSSQRILELDPYLVREFMDNAGWEYLNGRRDAGEVQLYPWLEKLLGILVGVSVSSQEKSMRFAVGRSALHLSLRTLDLAVDIWSGFNDAPIEGTNWGWIVEVERFAADPNIASLITALQAIKLNIATAKCVVSRLPWPLASVLMEFPDIDVAISAAQQGDVGDIDDWLAAEDRWFGRGSDFDFYTFPIWAANVSVVTGGNVESEKPTSTAQFDRALKAYSISFGIRKLYLAQLLLMFLAMVGRRKARTVVESMGPTEIMSIVRHAYEGRFVPISWIFEIRDVGGWCDVLNEIGELPNITLFPQSIAYSDSQASVRRRHQFLSDLVDLWMLEPEMAGLGRLIFLLLSDDWPDDISVSTPRQNALYISACIDERLDQLESWDVDELVRLLTSREAMSLSRGAILHAHPEKPDFDAALLNTFGQSRWHLSARLQENVSESQESVKSYISRIME